VRPRVRRGISPGAAMASSRRAMRAARAAEDLRKSRLCMICISFPMRCTR